MTTINSFLKIAVVAAGFLTVFLAAETGLAAKTSARSAQDMVAIREMLAGIDQKMNQLIAGQQKLSEEHKQLRYWINKRR